MALGDPYITLADIKHYMSIQNTDHDAELTQAIASASEEVEDYCHRQFNDAGSASARVFVPTSGCLSICDDFNSVTGLVIKADTGSNGAFATTLSATDYQLEPLNGIYRGKVGWPYWKVRLLNSVTFPVVEDRATVQITARWGWTTVPDPVSQACRILIADTFQLKDQRLGVAGSDAFGTIVRVKDSRMAAAKLKPYTRDSLLVDG